MFVASPQEMDGAAAPTSAELDAEVDELISWEDLGIKVDDS